jgi:ABC-type multidrug transport system fused ATPase/permease subunit
MLVGTFLELLGVALVIPVLTMLADPAGQGWVSRLLIRLFDAIDRGELAAAAMFLLVVIYLLKSLFISFQVWQQYAYSSAIQHRVCLSLYRLYLNQPYSFHLKNNSAMLIRNITMEVNLFVSSINGVLQVAAESMVVVAIVGLLCWYEPIGAAFLIVLFAAAGGIFVAVSRGSSLRWGKERQFHEGQRVKHMQQGFGSVKDAILLACQETIVGQFEVHNASSLKALRMQSTIQQYPRLWLEFVSVLGLAIVVISSINSGVDIATLIPTLGVFAAAAFRMIPSANRILTAMQAIRFGSLSVEKVCSQLSQLHVSPVPRLQRHSSNHVQSIRFDQVGFSYEGAMAPALRDINMSISHGEVVGVIGTSGAGKSTLIDLMLGLLSPSHGKILVDGADIVLDMGRWQSRVGYVPQSIYLMDDTLRRNIAFGCKEDEIDEAALEAAIEAAQLRYLLKDLPAGINTVLGERGIRLSGGQRQRIGIARALYRNPSVLVLDEATSALDTETESAVMAAVNALRGNKTVIIVAHRLSTLSSCDCIYRLSDGKIIADGPPSLMLVESTPGSLGAA